MSARCLAAVADNGPIAQLGAKALSHIHDKLRALAQDGRFKPEERQYLIDQWQRLQAQTESATKELQDARAQFAGLLQTLQSNEDFIGELVEIRQAEKALDVIRGLTQDIRNASSQLNKLIGGIKPPVLELTPESCRAARSWPCAGAGGVQKARDHRDGSSAFWQAPRSSAWRSSPGGRRATSAMCRSIPCRSRR